MSSSSSLALVENAISPIAKESHSNSNKKVLKDSSEESNGEKPKKKVKKKTISKSEETISWGRRSLDAVIRRLHHGKSVHSHICFILNLGGENLIFVLF